MSQRTRNALGYVIGGSYHDADAVLGRDGEDRLVNVHDVQGGLRCACRCVECGSLLVAKQGTQRAWHFAHDHRNPNCSTRKVREFHLDVFLRRALRDAVIVLPHGMGLQAIDGVRVVKVHDVSAPAIARKHVLTTIEFSWKGSMIKRQLAIEVRLTARRANAQLPLEYDLHDVPAVEIDLRKHRYGTDAMLHEAILRYASRSWLWRRQPRPAAAPPPPCSVKLPTPRPPRVVNDGPLVEGEKEELLKRLGLVGARNGPRLRWPRKDR